jgi:peptide/nickel transport system permease protein
VNEVFRALQASILLTGTAMLIGIFVGIPLGVISAVRQHSKLDLTLTGITFLGVSFPSFLLGLGLLYIVGLQLRLVPIAGMVTIGKPFDPVDLGRHLVLPALILGFGYSALFMRYTRASMLEVIHADYITTARSKGLGGRTVVVRHAFRNALIPIITIIGLSVPEVVGAAVVTEQVFSWPGVGLLMVGGVRDRDYFLIMGVTVVLALVVLVVNLATDIAYAFADPRIRYS